MFKRTVPPLTLLALLMIPVLVTHAQGPPDAMDDALADLSARVGTPVTVADLSNWQWVQTNYPDTSLGCPQPGQAYAQVITNGYQFLLTYEGVTYDYRVSADRKILILCPSPTPEPAPTAPATASPTPRRTPAATVAAPTATTPGRIVCADAMPTHLVAGIQAMASDTGIPKNIRSAPSTTSAILGQVPAGGNVTVLNGPECAENMVWWQIDYDTLIGWVAEGQNGVYWFEPVGPTLDTTPALTPGTAPETPESPQIFDLPANRETISADNAGQLARFTDLLVNEAVTAIAWSPDGATLAAAATNGIWLYNTAAFALPPRQLQVPAGPTYAVAFSPDRSTMATAHTDATVRLWDVATGGQRAILRGHSQPVFAVAFSPDGALLASGGGNLSTEQDSVIRLWDVATGTQVALLEGHTGPITALAFSPDGTLMASASMDRSVRLWDTVSATLATVLSGHTLPARAVAFSPDGIRLASGGNDGAIRLWDIASGEQVILEGHEDQVLVLAFNADGSVLASAGGPMAGPGDNSVRLWDVAADDEIAALDDYGAAPEARVTGLTFSPDGTALVFVSVEGDRSTIRIWSATP